MYLDPDNMEIVAPPRLLEGPTLRLTTELAAKRRRVYEETDPSTNFALVRLLGNFPTEPRPFYCGHYCKYITPSARFLLREAEPDLVCLWCLTCAVGNVVQRELYPEHVTTWGFGTDDKDHAAIARYYVSLLELHHESNSRAGATLMAQLSDSNNRLLRHLLWYQLTALTTERWLSEDGNLSLLQGANQVIRHLDRAKRLYEREHHELARELGLDLSRMF